MFTLLDSFSVKGKMVVTFHYDEIDETANVARLYCNDGTAFEIRDFQFENFTQCFTANKTKGVIIGQEVPERYLLTGNKIELLNA
jgi:hypothetical protein